MRMKTAFIAEHGTRLGRWRPNEGLTGSGPGPVLSHCTGGADSATFSAAGYNMATLGHIDIKLATYEPLF